MIHGLRHALFLLAAGTPAALLLDGAWMQLQATWMLLTGDTLDATTALRHGLVHRVSAPGELDADVQSTAGQIAGLGPQVMRQQKLLMRRWTELPFEDALDASVKAFGRAFTTGEPQRYMQHFFDRKRAG